MVKRMQILLLALLLAFFGMTRIAQGQVPLDSLVDVLPLAVGNQWTYRYYAEDIYMPGGGPGEMTIDSGIVTYRVTNKLVEIDSTRWQIRVHRNLVRHYFSPFPGGDTSYALSDSSNISLIERLDGQHQVYRNEEPYTIRLDVFPFTREYDDTTRIYRFRQVGPLGTTSFLSWIYPSPSPDFRSHFTFQQGVGLIQNSYNTGTFDVSAANEHYLLSSIITSSEGVTEIATRFSLHQNYPNPFNPTTAIRYDVPERNLVTLKVVDVLGREVETLIHAVQDAGEHSVQWNANAVTSGVYFYQLKAGKRLETKKMLLLK